MIHILDILNMNSQHINILRNMCWSCYKFFIKEPVQPKYGLILFASVYFKGSQSSKKAQATHANRQ